MSQRSTSPIGQPALFGPDRDDFTDPGTGDCPQAPCPETRAVVLPFSRPLSFRPRPRPSNIWLLDPAEPA